MSERLSQKELGTRLGVSSRQVHNLAEAGVVLRTVKNGRTSYLWPESMRRYIEHKIAAAAPADFAGARARKMAAEARLMEIELAKAEESVVSIEIHRDEVTRYAERLAGRVKAMPNVFANQIIGVADITEAAIRLEGIRDDLLRSLMAAVDEIEDASADEQ